MKHFLWLATKDRLLTNSLSYKRRMATEPLCVQCKNSEEDVLHIFRDCKPAKLIWKEIMTDGELQRFNSLSDAQWFKWNLQNHLESSLNTEVCWAATFTTTI